MESEYKTKKKRNFRENVNPLSALFFLYMFPVFKRNYKRGLKQTDLCDVLQEQKANVLGDKLENLWKESYSLSKKYLLHKILFCMFGFEFVVYGILQLVNEMMLVALLPISVGRFISYFEAEDGENEKTESETYVYGGMIVLCILVNAFVSHSTAMGLMHISLKMAVACSSFIYRKTLMLGQTSLVKITSGHIINLLSTDVSHFEYGLVLAHYIWIAPLQVVVGIYLLYNIVGFAAFLGISLHLLFIPLHIYFGKKKSDLRLRTALKTDTRVNLLYEILQGIKIIKMYAWEKSFGKLISLARRSEVKLIRACYYLDAITLTLEVVLPGFSIFLSVVAFIYLGNNIKASTVYSVIAIFDALRPSLTLMFSEAISNIAKVHITILRINNLLKCDDVISPKEYQDLDIKSPVPKVILTNVSAGWVSKDKTDLVLRNVSFNIENSKLVAVIGPVGCGKSSFLNIILKELPISSGSIEISGTTSYASQDPWIFPASVQQNILFGSIYDENRYKTVIKICSLESDINGFAYGDQTIVGERGSTLSGGQRARINLARCIYKEADVYLLDDPLSAVDAKVGKQLFQECIKNFLGNKICILVTHQIQYLKETDQIFILNEGNIIGRGNYNELQSSGLNFAKLLPNMQNDEELIAAVVSDENLKFEEERSEQFVYKENMEEQSVKANVYFSYFKYGGNVLAIVLLLSCFIASQIAESGYYFFISHWVDLEQTRLSKNATIRSDEVIEQQRTDLLYVYSGITATIITLALTQSVYFYSFLMRASINIHDSIFSKIISATMSFFNHTPSGIILNRFSDDLGEIDEYIPNILADTIQISLQLVGVIVVTSIINYWFLIPSLGLLFFFLVIRKIYMKTSRGVKRIEGIKRSPIFGHMSATLHGITTIRAFGAEEILKKEFNRHQDAHTSAWYLYISSNKAFTFWLDFICGIIASLIILSLLVFNKGYLGGDVGLVVNEFLSLMGVLQWGMNQWSELENHMTSVERILEYKDIKTERVLETAPQYWPRNGKIAFKNLSMSYTDNKAFVLKNLNFVINPKEKIGIVGRTGAGKSSIISALFQLYETEGTVTIDDVDISKIPLEILRSSISIIPQEPFLFTGSVRRNLDPFEEFPDHVLWDALEKVQLKEEVESYSLRLHANVTEAGSNFSVGQKQLICLARAIIRNNKILVLDEATANVDPHTDQLIQETIRKTFADCTVITIAHRLHSIIDSDRIMVLESGKLVEFDHPHVLLRDSSTRFYAMVQACGKTIAEALDYTAESNYNNFKG